MKKVDRRVRRTRRSLRGACIALILEKGYEAITVEEIAERADVGRTTFYMHYRDKEDLFARSVAQISEELYERVAPQVFSPEGFVSEKPLFLIYQHALENADLYRVILSGAGNGRGLQQLRRDLAEYTTRVFEAEVLTLDLKPAVPIHVVARHFVGALLETVHWWLEADIPYPAEEIIQMFRELTSLVRDHVIGIERQMDMYM